MHLHAQLQAMRQTLDRLVIDPAVPLSKPQLENRVQLHASDADVFVMAKKQARPLAVHLIMLSDIILITQVAGTTKLGCDLPPILLFFFFPLSP